MIRIPSPTLPLPPSHKPSPDLPESPLEAGIAQGVDQRIHGRVEIPQPNGGRVNPGSQATLASGSDDEQHHVGQPAQDEGTDDDPELTRCLRLLAQAGDASSGRGAPDDPAGRRVAQHAEAGAAGRCGKV